MKLLSKPTTIAEFIWLVALCACLLLFYFLCKFLGFSDSYSKGISLLLLFLVIALYLIVDHAWVKLRWRQRFNGLSTEQNIIELDKVLVEVVSKGIVTHEELEEMRVKAKSKFEQ